MKLKTCVSPNGCFVYGVHHPHFHISNFRDNDNIRSLGSDGDGNDVLNTKNYPEKAVDEPNADLIYEVPNPFPFRGTTYINSAWADGKSRNPGSITLTFPSPLSFSQSLKQSMGESVDLANVMSHLPPQMLVTIAAESSDIEELKCLADMCCSLTYKDGHITGFQYESNKNGHLRPQISNHVLFEALVNNPYLPDDLKEAMVLRPGVQGASEITAEYTGDSGRTHIYEYLRRNSYIPWGHFAANMAEDAVRYDMAGISETDMLGLRHLYYQRTYARIGEMLGLPALCERKTASVDELETLRIAICEAIRAGKGGDLFFNATLWGWNYGYHFTPSGYNLHGSHQQIHQQYALIPKYTPAFKGSGESMGDMETYGCGDQVYAFIRSYRRETGHDFFTDYLNAIYSNKRMDSADNPATSLIVHEDDHVILFVPKAQTSQWELNLMTKKPFAHILETDTVTRASLDAAMLLSMRTLTRLGARMISVIEFSGRFDMTDERQHLLYSFLPKIPYSMGAFTEAQQRFINGHYPEDFAKACRNAMVKQN